MLTIEQQAVVDAVCSITNDNRIIAVNSIAGSGKTSTGNAVIQAYQPKNGFYTAFNKAIVTDSAKKFGKLLECKTIHALAYKYVKPTKNIEELNYLTIKEPLDYESKAIVISTLDGFFRSSSIDVEEYATQAIPNDTELQNIVIKYANKMLNGDIPPTFNYLLKCLHIMLENKEIEIHNDLVILDECQDTTAVTLEIFKLINADKKVIFGDKYQNIYSFMNTVNAFELLDNLNLFRLTKSFRCNPDIAAIVENFGKRYLEENFQYKGNENIESNPNQIAFITRTNASLIERMNILLSKDSTFSLTRSINDIFALPIALTNASLGKSVFDKKYKFLEYEYINYKKLAGKPYKSFYEYLFDNVDDSSIENTVKVLMNFKDKNINIYDVKNLASNMKINKNTVLTTSHAFKGLEKDTVYIENDLNNSVNKAIESFKFLKDMCNGNIDNARKLLSRQAKEDLNTYYVALSRAKNKLINVGYLGY